MARWKRNLTGFRRVVKRIGQRRLHCTLARISKHILTHFGKVDETELHYMTRRELTFAVCDDLAAVGGKLSIALVRGRKIVLPGIKHAVEIDGLPESMISPPRRWQQ
jgi:hypothetical protein